MACLLLTNNVSKSGIVVRVLLLAGLWASAMNIAFAGEVKALDQSPLNFRQLEKTINQQVARESVPSLSFALIHRNNVAFSHQAGVLKANENTPVTNQTVFEVASLSKPVFAVGVLRLAEQGLIDLDKPLYKYLPFDELEKTDKSYRTVTARMVLAHTSGFPNWRWFDKPPASVSITRGDMFMKAAPGEFSYSGEAYHYLARVVMKLTDSDEKSLDKVLTELVPVKDNSDIFWTWDPSLSQRKAFGHKQGEPTDRDWPMSFPDDTSDKIGVAGRLHTNAETYAHFLTALYNEQYINRRSLMKMFTVQSAIPPDTFDYKSNCLVGWGLGVALGASEFGSRHYHGGNNGDFQSGFTIYRSGEIGFVFVTNGDDGERLHRLFESIIENGTP